MGSEMCIRDRLIPAHTFQKSFPKSFPLVVIWLERAQCTVVTRADEPTAVHLPGSRLHAPRTGRPIRSGGLGLVLVVPFLAPLDSSLRVHASFDSYLCSEPFALRCDLNSIHSTIKTTITCQKKQKRLTSKPHGMKLSIFDSSR